MTVDEIKEYLDRKRWHSIEVQYLHKSAPEVRTAYFRGETVDDAVRRFNDMTDPGEDIILTVCLDTEIYEEEEE